jgi:hypothetical protein
MKCMTGMNPRPFDLNLLLVFETILREGSVARAWRRQIGSVRTRAGFFERHAFMPKKMPKCIVTDQKTAVGQLLEKSAARPTSRWHLWRWP